MIRPIEWSSKVPSNTSTAVAISASDLRRALLKIFKPAKSCLCALEENSSDLDILQ